MAGLEEGLLLAVFHRLGYHHWGVGFCYDFTLSWAEKKRSENLFQGTVCLKWFDNKSQVKGDLPIPMVAMTFPCMLSGYSGLS